MPGIYFNKWSYTKARVKTFCELFYARKLVKARELQFLGGCVVSCTLIVGFLYIINAAFK